MLTNVVIARHMTVQHSKFKLQPYLTKCLAKTKNSLNRVTVLSRHSYRIKEEGIFHCVYYVSYKNQHCDTSEAEEPNRTFPLIMGVFHGTPHPLFAPNGT